MMMDEFFDVSYQYNAVISVGMMTKEISWHFRIVLEHHLYIYRCGESGAKQTCFHTTVDIWP